MNDITIRLAVFLLAIIFVFVYFIVKKLVLTLLDDNTQQLVNRVERKADAARKKNNENSISSFISTKRGG